MGWENCRSGQDMLGRSPRTRYAGSPMRISSPIILLVGLLALPFATNAQDKPALTLSDRTGNKTFTLPQLLADPAAREVAIDDPVYRKRMTYRAIPMTALLKGLEIAPDDYVQARATDN